MFEFKSIENWCKLVRQHYCNLQYIDEEKIEVTTCPLPIYKTLGTLFI